MPREILPVSTTFNRLLATVRTILQTQQQFLANTAHQLRTPIAGLSAQLELLAADPAAAPVKDRVAALGEGMRQLAHTTNQLLMLARADTAAQRLQPRNETVELQHFATDVVARFVDRAVLAEIDLGLNAHAARIRVDQALLDDLLGNLIDNALKYTSKGGVVTVGTGIDASQPYIEVDDNGCGIPEAERQWCASDSTARRDRLVMARGSGWRSSRKSPTSMAPRSPLLTAPPGVVRGCGCCFQQRCWCNDEPGGKRPRLRRASQY